MDMYRSVLVPLDGSPFSEQALPLARTIARASGAALHLAQVYVPGVKQPIASQPSSDAGLEAEHRRREQAYLDAIATRLGIEAEIKVVPVLLDGPIADTLGVYVSTNDIDLVVMTTHGRGGINRLWLGSIADTLARRITVPLLLIRPSETPPELTAHCSLHRFLVPLDGSTLAEEILEPILELARLMAAECMLFHAVEPLFLPRYASIDYDANLEMKANESLRRDAEQYLGMIAQRIQAAGVAVHTKVVLEPQPVVGIIRAAGEADIDVIAMATQGRSGLTRLLLGSVTDKVVRASEIPVLVYRPKASGA
jgi:nucleotide-binding universal stress UspA family protein